jgi:thiol-disulfide isomerase/thioredoxin
MTGALRGLVLVLVIGTAAAGGFFGYRLWQDHQGAGAAPLTAATTPAPAAEGDKSSSPTATVAASTPADASPTADPPPPAVPQNVPDIRLPDLKGAEKQLRDYLGRPVIINFWATWCGPCRREIPLLQQLRQTYRGERLEVVGIAVDKQEAVAQYLQKTPISYPLLVGEDQGFDAAQKFGMELVLPFSVFADAQGRIITVKVGELHKDEADYILGVMGQVAAGRKSIEEARSGIAEKLRTFAVEHAKAETSRS